MVDQRYRWVVIACIAAACGAHSAYGAYLQKQQSDTFVTPLPAPLQTGPGCDVFPNGSAASDVGLNGQSAFANTLAESRNVQTNAACNQSVVITATANATFTLLPGPGESTGDTVMLCLQANFDQTVSATNALTAQSQAAGNVTLNPTSMSPETILSYGLLTLMNNDPERRLVRAQEFGAQIGDVLQLATFSHIDVHGMGIGTASALSSAQLNVTIGPCAQPAPAVSHGNLMIMAVLLPVAGWLLLFWKDRMVH